MTIPADYQPPCAKCGSNNHSTLSHDALVKAYADQYKMPIVEIRAAVVTIDWHDGQQTSQHPVVVGINDAGDVCLTSRTGKVGGGRIRHISFDFINTDLPTK